MYSMTGYGRADYSLDGINLTVELKSVNNRNFDLNIKMPRAFIMFEDLIRKTVMKYVSRARIDLFINFTDTRENKGAIVVDMGKAKEYLEAGKQISTSLGIQNDLTTSIIMRYPEVVTDNGVADYTGFEDVIEKTVDLACQKFNEMRLTEGQKLVSDMVSRMQTISEIREKIKTRAPLVALEYKKRLTERIKEALEDVKYDEARLLNEVAFYTDRVNIDEELTRLSSHIKQFNEIIKTEKCGKKLDFLMQEFNRETNTICSKSNDLEVTNFGLMLKNEIEKVREQVQNLE